MAYNNNRTEKAPAVWNLVKHTGINRLYASEGGAIKITREDDRGEEKLIAMMPTKQYLKLAGMVDFINDTAKLAEQQVERVTEQRDREKIKLQVQVQAGKALEHLKALGLSPEQIQQALIAANKQAA